MYIPDQLRWFMTSLPCVSSNEALGCCLLYRTLERSVLSWRRLLLWRRRLRRCLLMRTEQNLLGRLKRHLHHLNLLSFAFPSSHCVSTNLERTPRGASSQNILSPFLKAILQMCWHSQKAERAPTCGRNQNLLRFLRGTLPQRTWMLFLRGASPSLLWLLYGAVTFSWECAREGSGEERNALLAERERKKEDLLSLGFVYHTQDTPRPFSRGIFFFFYLNSLLSDTSLYIGVLENKNFRAVLSYNLGQHWQLSGCLTFTLFGFVPGSVNMEILVLKRDVGLPWQRSEGWFLLPKPYLCARNWLWGHMAPFIWFNNRRALVQ